MGWFIVCFGGFFLLFHSSSRMLLLNNLEREDSQISSDLIVNSERRPARAERILQVVFAIYTKIIAVNTHDGGRRFWW